MGGMIGVLSGDLARYSDFTMSLLNVQKPEGTRLAWAKGVDIAGNCNIIVRTTLEANADWMWLLGDDHVFQPDLLQRLLRVDVDVVVPLCLKRAHPYQPVVYQGQREDGAHIIAQNLPAEGLCPIYGAGSAGMLVKRRVLDAIEPPWFKAAGTNQNEDLYFCAKIREAGFQMWCLTDAPLGHIGVVKIWPEFTEDGWAARLDTVQ